MNRQHIIAALLTAGLALAGCAGPLGDFRPLYATAAGPALPRIQTNAPDGRTGYLLREQLDDALGLDRNQPPLYRLNLTLKEFRTPRGLRTDNVANRYELLLQTKYVLIDIGARRILTTGAVASTVTYDSADQAYAAVAANLDGQKRVAADTAQRLTIALGAYFANPDSAGPPSAAAPEAHTIETPTDRMAGASIDSPSAQAESQPGRAPIDQGQPQ
jgi:LPS-assembly lipoprotein